MAEQKIAAPFPAPPPFYKHFTKENLAELRRLRQEASIPPPPTDPFSVAPSSEPTKDLDPASLPSELRYLLPPSPPQDGKYVSFGATIDQHAAEPTLADAEIEQLYPASAAVRLNPQPQLVTLARSLLTTFLSLTGVLGRDPERHEPAVQDLQTLLYNMHDLLNQYRPHQARESLILLMEERVARMRAEVEGVEAAKKRVRVLLEGLVEGGELQKVKEGEWVEEVEGRRKKGKGGEGDDADRKRRQRAAWRALEGLGSG